MTPVIICQFIFGDAPRASRGISMPTLKSGDLHFEAQAIAVSTRIPSRYSTTSLAE